MSTTKLRGETNKKLTKRETEIAQLAGQGLIYSEIARRLFITEKTVQTHLGNVYTKLGISNKAGLATMVSQSASEPMAQRAVYLDGQPNNLAAAANDALDWMRIFHKYMECKMVVAPNGDPIKSEFSAENIMRLRLAIEALERFQPDKPPVFKNTGFVDGYQGELSPYPAKGIALEVERNAKPTWLERQDDTEESNPVVDKVISAIQDAMLQARQMQQVETS